MPINKAPLPARCGSLDNNRLCGLDVMGRGTYTADGINALCEGLKRSGITSLRCGFAPKCSPSRQRPLTRLDSCARSLENNRIGVEGGEAVAAVLPQTQITNLKYAATFAPSQSVNAH